MKTRVSLLAVIMLSVIMAVAHAGTLTMPEDLTEIEAEAFLGIKNISTVILPEGVTDIGNRAFAGSSVTEINLPESLSDIAPDAFADCAQLTASVLPGTYALDYCVEYGVPYRMDCTPAEAFVYTVADGAVTITGYTGAYEKVIMPAEIEGCPVTAIAKSAFSGNKAIRSVYIPGTVTTIGNGVFQNCTSLTSAALGKGVASMGESTFKGCSALESVRLPVTLETIGSYAFYGCAGLSEVVIPEGVTSIETRAFENCAGLEAVSFPSTLVTVGDYAFQKCSSLKSVAFAEGLESIGIYAFNNCKAVAEMDLPDSITSIGAYGFGNCTSLTYFDYPMSLSKVPNISNTFTGVIPGCTNLTEVTLPEGLTTTPAYLFSNCTNILKVNLPSTLESIGNRTFNGCTGLVDIVLPEGLVTIDERAFENCTGLEAVSFPSTLVTVGDYAFQKCSSLKSVAFAEGLESIGIYAFNNCKAVAEMDLPDSITSIGAYGFGNCTSLTYFDYPMSLSKVPNISNTFTGVIPGCTNLTEVTLPEGLTTTPAYLFSNCTNILKVNLPSTLESIGNRTFNGCTGLVDIVLPEGLVTIGERAFENCTGLPALDMPSTLRRVESFAFQKCTSMKEIVYPDGLIYLGCYAHCGCSALETMDLPDSIESLGEGAFKNCVALKHFDYPMNWQHRPYLGNSADILKGCTSLTELTIPEGVENLPDRAFEGCDTLVKVNLPSTLKTVSMFAFANCTSLVDCDIPYGVQHLNWGSFSGCKALTDIYLPTTVYEAGSFSNTWFSNHHADFTIESEYGAKAIAYAIKYDLKYYYLSYTGRHYPKDTLYRGDVFNITGYVRSTLPLTEVTATICDADTGAVVRQKTVAPGVKDYSLANAINTAMDLDTLDLGNYTFTLTGATEKTAETFVNTRFSVVPPPLRVYLRDYSPLNGFIAAGDEQTVAGTVVANYPITALKVQIIADTEDEVIEYAVEPGAETYDLSNLSITSAGLGVNAYTMQVVVSGNGETKTVGRTGFSLTDDAVPDGFTVDYDALSAFLADKTNRELFDGCSVDYRLTIESNMTEQERFNLAMSQRNDKLNASIRDGLDEILMGVDDADTYLIELYKKEIADFIVDMGAASETYTYDASMAKLISESIVSYHKINIDYITENYGGMPECDLVFLEGMSTVMEKVNDVSGFVDAIGDLADIVDVIYQDYSRGIEILEYLSAQYVGNEQYQYAVEELKCEYYSRSYRAFNNLFTYAYKQAADSAAGAFTDIVLKAMGSELYAIFKIADLAEQVLDEAYDIYGDSNDYIVYSTQCETYQNARAAFKDAFDRAAEDLTNVDNVVRLRNSFEVTRLSAIRAIDTLLNMKHYNCVDETYPLMDRKALKTMTLPF